MREYRRAVGQLELLRTKKAEGALLRVRQRYYAKANKADSLLARLPMVAAARNAITALKSGSGERVTRAEEIREELVKFFESLYTSQHTQEWRQVEFLDRVKLGRIEERALELLNKEITEEEVGRVLRDLPLNKAPGPDGYTAAFYKTFAPQLIPHLTYLFNTFKLMGKITPSMEEARLTLILKPGKDPEEKTSYRPIALINIDAKIFTKVLANRLEGCLPDLIHPDQAGFIRGRQTADNIIRVSHLVEKAHGTDTPAVLLSLDAEKAFHCVEWAFLFRVMQKMGIGGGFCA